MGKLLTWVLIALAAWAAWRMWTISQRRAERARAKREAGDGAAATRGGDARPDEGTARVAGPERMMQCAVCGVHLPGSEARFAGGKVYCSDAHRDRAAADPPGRVER
jgi:uncharacterized protein